MSAVDSVAVEALGVGVDFHFSRAGITGWKLLGWVAVPMKLFEKKATFLPKVAAHCASLPGTRAAGVGSRLPAPPGLSLPPPFIAAARVQLLEVFDC